MYNGIDIVNSGYLKEPAGDKMTSGFITRIFLLKNIKNLNDE